MLVVEPITYFNLLSKGMLKIEYESNMNKKNLTMNEKMGVKLT